MNPTRHLSFGSLRHALSSLFHHLPDPRQASKVDYLLHDALMSGFACMFFQDPSLLQFQKRLEDEKHRNNLHTLFGIHETPESTQMRTVIESSLWSTFPDLLISFATGQSSQAIRATSWASFLSN
mgnify:CR=1 FL=1